MCGIIGITGADSPAGIVLDGLAILEYRGYDSAGIAIVDEAEGTMWRERRAVATRSLEVLAPLASTAPRRGAAIGHTRWATHGTPSEANAHPHADCTGRVALVHNGIIENHRELAEQLVAAGHTLSSETDTEVIAHLVEDELRRGATLFEALRIVVGRLHGDFALAVVCVDEPDVIAAARSASPLVLGVGPGVGVVGSDVAALLGVASELYVLDDREVAEVRPGSLRVVAADGSEVRPQQLEVTWNVEDAKKGGFADFMSKEIREQPRAVTETLLGRISPDGTTEFEELSIDAERLASIDRVVLIGCGSSWHAALVGRGAIEHFARLSAEVDISSEFRYRNFVANEKTLVVAVSQSGETIDTLHALREARRRGAVTLGVTNVVGSLMAREADGVLYTRAGPEVGVASTKTTLAQIALLEAFALHLGTANGALDRSTAIATVAELESIADHIESVVSRSDAVDAVARRFYQAENFFFLGRRTGFPVALEGALKLKELAYVRAEAYPAGELKHGPIALIDSSSIVVAVATRTELFDKVLSNIAEVRARGAVVIALVEDGDEETAGLVDAVLEVPRLSEFASPLVDIVPFQLFAYAVARARGNDVDRPRNLAKVVTVE